MKVREHVPGVEMDVQTENYTEDRGTQWERQRDAKGNPIPEPGESEDEKGEEGGERSNGGRSSGSKGPSLLNRASAGASVGAKHGLIAGYGMGAVGGAFAVAAGYALGLSGGAVVGGAQGAGTVIGNAIVEGAGEDFFGGSPTPEPLAAKPPTAKPEALEPHQSKPADPVPPWLLDREEREAAAKKPTIAGQWASKQHDKQRLDKQKTKDKQAERKREAEAVIARHL